MTSSQTYDAAGNVIADVANKRYVYDAENRLIEVDPASGGQNYYQYDADGRRSRRRRQ